MQAALWENLCSEWSVTEISMSLHIEYIFTFAKKSKIVCQDVGKIFNKIQKFQYLSKKAR